MLRSADSPYITPTDAELLHRFLQTRDDAAFGRLVARHGEPVRRVATRATGNPSAAEDVAQAAFIVLARRPRAAWLSACCRGSALPWLARTTRYAAATWRRTEARRRRHESAAAHPERQDPSQPGELTEAVAAALARMNRAERRLITLRHLDEKPWPDVARQLGMTPEAARKATARALARLRERLRTSGVVVTPAALAIALGTLARPSHAAIVVGGSISAFEIARGVLTMMKIKSAGLAGAALVAAVMSAGVVSTGMSSAWGASPGSNAQPLTAGLSGADEAESQRRTEREVQREEAAPREQDEDRPEPFTPNEHQPSVTLADGTKLTLLCVSNGDDGWWHADGTRARAPRHYLSGGLGGNNMTVTVDDDSTLLDMAFYAEGPNAGEENEDGEKAQERHWINLASVLVGRDKTEPNSVGIGINSKNGRASWRVMASDTSDAETSEAWLCIATGEAEKVGEIQRDEDGGWKADEDAQRWVSLGMEEKKLIVEAGEPDEESAAITVIGVGEKRHHGHVSEGRMVFEEHALRGVDRLEVYRRPLEVVRLSNMAKEAEQDTEPRMRIVDEPMILMTSSHSLTTVTGGTHNRSTVGVGGKVHGHAEATGGGGAKVTSQGKAGAQGGGGKNAGAQGGSGRGGSDGGGSGQNDPDDDR